MSFILSNLVDLLEALESLYREIPPLSSFALSQKVSKYISSWFTFHLPTFQSNPRTLVAIFSFLLPGLRADRTYALREKALSKIIGRCLLLGKRRQNDLTNWNSSIERDFSSVVQRIMAQAENPLDKAISIEDVEEGLNKLAARCRFSSGALKTSFATSNTELNMETGVEHILDGLYKKLSSKEGKWVTRAILKCHLPVVIPENHTLGAYHFLLPYLLSFQHDLEKACHLICSAEYSLIPRSPASKQDEIQLLGLMSAALLKPEVGTKVGRPDFIKARSCKHAARIAAGRRMSMERKYDGEYCQIHIDLSKGDNGWLQIFSKSGRDSTGDRVRVHDTIREALGIDKPQKRAWTKCIIEGELVVYNDREKRIMEFHHIRSHVNRAGVYIGNAKDGSRDRSSHLMILLFDCLLYNHEPLLHCPYSTRVEFLRKILPHPLTGRVELAEAVELDFAQSVVALEKTRTLFAAGIVKRWEGFVLKPIDEPYVSLMDRRTDLNTRTHGWAGGKAAWIKLKKDYIQGCGDTGDFAVVGGGANRERAWERKLKAGALTVFHIGCLLNKVDIQKFRATPKFRVVFQVTYNISKSDLEWINQISRFEAIQYKKGQKIEQFELEIVTGTGMVPIDCIFPKPFVFEIMGGGFEKPTNCSFYIPRHPRVCKIHWDRSYLEALSFAELQEAATEALNVGNDDFEDMQTESQWIEKLLEKDLSIKELGNKRQETMVATAKSNVPGESSKSTTPTKDVVYLPVLVPSSEATTGLHDILQPLNKHRKSLQGSIPASCLSKTGPAAGSSKYTDTTISYFEEIFHNLPVKRPRLAKQPSSPKQEIGRSFQLILTTAALQLRNGHSSISPLSGATVFIPQYLMKFPKLIERITDHDAQIILVLPTAENSENIRSLMPINKKGIVLIESNKECLTKKTLRELYVISRTVNHGLEEGQGYRWETYDWRIVNHHQPEGMWETDWSLWHVWSVV